MEKTSHARFIIVSLPRSGSTTLAKILNLHDEIRCLIEPFHPKRYGGLFYDDSIRADSLTASFEFIWRQWTGIKHVWEANGWPFIGRPQLAVEVIQQPDVRILYLLRRNYLRRLVSNYICYTTKYWIGSKEQFDAHVAGAKFERADPERFYKSLVADVAATSEMGMQLDKANAKVLRIYYEDLFGDEICDSNRYQLFCEMLTFLGRSGIPEPDFRARILPHITPSTNRWSSAELYRRIPDIDLVEAKVGNDLTGWLFR